eukprot:6526848-Pyramimonas_sp.AAC.1
MPRDIEDSANAFAALAEPTAIFADEQRVAMASAVSSRVKSGRASCSGASQTQAQLRLCHYLTGGLWETVMAKDNSWEMTKETMADVLLKIGARRPSGPTVKHVLATLSRCHGRSLQP